MRLAIFLPSLAGGGAERVMLNVARGAAARGLRVDLVLVKAEGPYLRDIPQEIRLVDLRARRMLTCMPGLVRYLRRERPQALVSALTHANVTALWARRLAGVKTRVIVTEHTTIGARARRSQHWRERLLPVLAHHFYPWADAITAPSQGAADDLAIALRLDRRRVHVMYNPVVTPELKRLRQSPVNHPWFTENGPPVVLGVGSLTEPKDFRTLVCAFALVRKQCNVRLLILGDGEQRSQLEALVKDIGLEDDVSLPGFVENPYGFMSKASVFVLSSVWEGLPTVLIEALACGTPVVSTDCPSGPREILEDGRWGKLVPVGDADALAQAIAKTLASPVNSSQLEARAEEFSVDKIVPRYLALLEMAGW